MKRTSINDNFTNIFNYIQSSKEKVTYADLLQYVIDYDQYKEYYLNYHIFKDILLEKNESLDNMPEMEVEKETW